MGWGIGDWIEEHVTSKVKDYGKYIAPVTWAVGRGAQAVSKGQSVSEAGKEAGSDWGLTPSPSKTREAAAAANSAANAAVRQAEYEEQAAAGLERNKAKRRRGFQSTILSGTSSATLGSSGTGKTLLGD